MTKNELIVESCRNMAFQDLRDTLSSALDNRDATIAALRAELDAANIKANAWDELWSACEQWGDATAHRELEGKGRTVESLLDYAKQNKELRAEVERAKTVIENYELDYDRVVVRGEKCAMELAVAEAATLRAEVEMLKGENEGLLKLDLHTLNVVKGRMDAMLGGNAVVRIMAMSYGEMFRNAGGENFCTQTLTDWSDEANPLTLEVTIRKYPDGKTPEVVMGEMRAELTQLREDRRVLGAEVKAWRQNEPYRDRMFRDDGLEVAIKATDAYNALERSNG